MVAHLRAARQEAGSRNIPCRELQEYVQTPGSIEATRAALAAETGASVTQIKSLYNATGYGSRGHAFEEQTGRPVPSKVVAVRNTMEELADAMYEEATPEQRAACDARKGKTTYLSLKLQERERSWVERAATVHQGIPLCRLGGFIYDSCITYSGYSGHGGSLARPFRPHVAAPTNASS